jgi:hypothetical protein
MVKEQYSLITLFGVTLIGVIKVMVLGSPMKGTMKNDSEDDRDGV